MEQIHPHEISFLMEIPDSLTRALIFSLCYYDTEFYFRSRFPDYIPLRCLRGNPLENITHWLGSMGDISDTYGKVLDLVIDYMDDRNPTVLEVMRSTIYAALDRLTLQGVQGIEELLNR